jgi:hypothetical protein
LNATQAKMPILSSLMVTVSRPIASVQAGQRRTMWPHQVDAKTK